MKTAKAAGKLVADYGRLSSTKEFLAELSSMHSLAVDVLPVPGVPKNNHDAALKIATHVVASSPKFLSKDEMAPEAIKEIEDALIEKLREEGKPEKSWEMIMKGQMKKKLSEFVLMEQPLYCDAKTTVGEYCQENGIIIHSYKSVTV